MKLNNTAVSTETKARIAEALKGENKEEAITNAMDILATSMNESLIKQIVEESAEADADKEFKNRLGLRTLSKAEHDFYSLLKSRQAITADQIDIIPTTVVDNTMANVKKASPILDLVRFAPADVKKWVSASKTGTYAWGTLTSALGDSLTATISSMNVELGKLSVVIVVPKAIRELSDEFVDKYLTAILEETFTDGLEFGFLCGTGDNMPIGITKQLAVNSTVTGHTTEKADKALTACTGFTPKLLAPTRKVLAHNGLRTVSELVLIVNPLDRIQYVDPALLKMNDANIYTQVSPIHINVMESINCPQGKGIFTVADAYDMGYSGLTVDEYTETKALDDANVLVAKCYANGRPTDDDTAVVFDVTKLAALA